MIAFLAWSLVAPLQQLEDREVASRRVALAAVRDRLTGSFEAVERNARGEATGRMIARALPGAFLGRDYWSEAGGRRIYAGHDVLELRVDGSAAHWWFGSKGDFAAARGRWDVERLELVVRDEDGDPLRRYRYRFDRPQLAFHFQNDHADGDGWEYFMDADWRRAEIVVPADFAVPDRPAGRGPFAHYAGRRRDGQADLVGRVLFDDWLVLDDPSGHGVLSTGWFGQVELRWWGSDGAALSFTGTHRDGEIALEATGRGGNVIRRRDTLLPDGFRTALVDAEGTPLAAPRHWKAVAPG